MSEFVNCVIVTDHQGYKLYEKTVPYYLEGRHHNIQIKVMGHKPA